jgi:hypothetical protein
MKIANTSRLRWQLNKANVRGKLTVKKLLVGQPGTAENYLCNIARSDGDYASPRHRHNFDQVRIVLDGRLPVTPRRTMTPGQIGYFPEGTPYGPQMDDGTGWTIMIVQFGGASGEGFLSADEAQSTKESLSREGEFQGGVFKRASGKGKRNQDSYEAVWERASGRRLIYPKPRYDAPVILDPEGFDWTSKTRSGVARKNLGIFTERETRLELTHLDGGAGWSSKAAKAIQLYFVMGGTGTCNGEKYGRHSLIEATDGEALQFQAKSDTELFSLTMPRIKSASRRAA